MQMLWTLLKWAVPVLLVVVAAAAVFTKKTFHVETVIAAPPAKVWSILVDTRKYSEWNPVFIAVDGSYAQGQTVINTVRFPDGSDVKMGATVKAFDVRTELRQTGGLPGFLTFDHQWLLEEVEGGTRVIQHEVDRGLWLWFWNSDWIEPAYSKVLEALAKRATKE